MSVLSDLLRVLRDDRIYCGGCKCNLYLVGTAGCFEKIVVLVSGSIAFVFAFAFASAFGLVRVVCVVSVV